MMQVCGPVSMSPKSCWQGFGVYRFANKYGANVDGYSPIYTPDVWSETGNEYKLGTKGLLAWCAPHIDLLFKLCCHPPLRAASIMRLSRESTTVEEPANCLPRSVERWLDSSATLACMASIKRADACARSSWLPHDVFIARTQGWPGYCAPRRRPEPGHLHLRSGPVNSAANYSANTCGCMHWLWDGQTAIAAR